MLEFSELQKFFDPRYRPYDNHKDIAQAENIEIHAKGKKPEVLLRKNRPNEKPIYTDYRIERFEAVTKTYWSKIMTVIQKIQFSEDFKIKYKEEPSKLSGYPFGQYLTKGYPMFDSYENWFWSIGYQNFLEDANGLYICLSEYAQTDSEPPKPFIYFIESDDILDFKTNHYALVEMEEKSVIEYAKEEQKKGRILLYIDTEKVEKWEQYGKFEENTFRLISSVNHGCSPYLPAWKSGGNVREIEDGNISYDSFLRDTLPFFNEAVNWYSDHQVNMALHIHPDRWEIASSPCRVCDEKGYFLDKKDASIRHSCNTCGGSGKVVQRTPFNVMQIQPASKTGINDITQIPTPPAGYITRPQENVQYIYEQYKEAIKSALASINMEFLMDVPMSESGVAKLVDRQELNTFLLKITRHIVFNIWTPSFYFIAKQRYGNILSEKEVMDLIPFVQIPNQFDIMTSDIMAQRVGYAIEKKMPNAIISKLAYEYAESEFGADDIETIKLKLTSQLDPLPFMSEEDKMTVLGNQGTTKLDYIISSNIYKLVGKALEENKDFSKLTYAQQNKIITDYAKVIDKSISSGMTPIYDGVATPLDTPIDIEAEAKARLKGSVGGVQGILEIQNSVSQGITDYSAAISLLYEIFGFDDATARRILGTPKKVNPNVNTNS